MEKRTLKLLQKFRAEGIPAPAIRNQGAKKVLFKIRKHLRLLRLRSFIVDDELGFDARLDTATKRLITRLPGSAQNWGAARKALNLFLRDCTYDYYLRRRYKLRVIEPWLEVPLDRYVAIALREETEGESLPRWDSLKRLKPDVSRQYQDVARKVARRMRICRVHLDLYYWRGDK